jgi:hypothetical protein
MKKYKNLFIISSALQSVSVFLILQNNKSFIPDSIVFIEEGLSNFPDAICETRKILPTRNKKSAINNNCKYILSFSDQQSTLWVSDLFWPMNNAIYTHMRSAKQLLGINFIDEGMVLYWLAKMGKKRYIRELLKSIYLKIFLGNYYILNKNPFLVPENKSFIYAYHPELISSSNKFKIEINKNNLNKYRVLSGINFDEHILSDDVNVKAALFLAGPYYRLSSKHTFDVLLASLSKRLTTLGYKKLYIKLHPTETIDDYKIYYENHGFELAFFGEHHPIEVYGDLLGEFLCVVGFNSSALLNLRKFGFKGILLSYGLDYISSLAKLDFNLMGAQKKLFESQGVIFENLALNNE